jgi:hypothetical protein
MSASLFSTATGMAVAEVARPRAAKKKVENLMTAKSLCDEETCSYDTG